MDRQFRNYSERSTKMFKKMVNNLAKAKKDNGLPALTKSSWDIFLMVAADTCNKVPLGSVDGSFISLFNLLGYRENTIRITEMMGKLQELKNMMNNLRQYYEIVN